MSEVTQPRPLIVEPWQSRVDRKWRVRIRGANGGKVMVSEAYNRKQDANRAAQRLADCSAAGFDLRLAA